MKRLVCGVLIALVLLTSAALAQENTPSTPTPYPYYGVYTTYTVLSGDTMGRIAARFGVTTGSILAANNLANPNLVYVGERLLIPLPTPIPSPTRGSPTPQIEILQPQGTPTYNIVNVEPSATPQATLKAAPTVYPSIGFELGAEFYNFLNLNVMPEAGMTWAAYSLTWKLGDSDSTARHAIEQVHAAGLKVLLKISGNPQELGKNSTQYINSFATYLGTVAMSAPDAIEVWSDMNVAQGWTSGQIDPSAYQKMLSAAYAQIKRADPNVLVISGALAQSNDLDGQCSNAGCDDLPYLQGMMKAGVGSAADCIGLNYTLGAVPPGQATGDSRGSDPLYYYSAVVNTYAAIFPDKPLCFTEVGYLVPGTSSNYEWALNTTPATQAIMLAQAARLAQQSGRIRLFIVYNLDATQDGLPSHYAILGPDNACITCLTLKTVMQQSP